MTFYRFIYSLLVLGLSSAAVCAESKRDHLFDVGWRFHRGDAAGAEQPAFDDSGWRTLDLPHDWSIEDLPSLPKESTAEAAKRIVSGPFDSEAPGGQHTGFTVGGIGWYRKHFTLPENTESREISIQFDGVYMDADVWINGHHLGSHPFGYTSFAFDLSPYLNYGKEENVLVVRVRNEGLNSRWYSGSGIYRHVWLRSVDPLHIARWGTFVTTPDVDSDKASVHVQTKLENGTGTGTGIKLAVALLDPDSKVVASRTITPKAGKEAPFIVELDFDVSNPRLWSPDSPALYRAVCVVMRDGKPVDRTETVFGIRSFRFDPDKGFFLNGENMKMKGGCVHANNGPLGAAAFDRAEERRVELLKAAGYNAVRCAHNPPSPAFLDACDRLGMLVIDEFCDEWTVPHRPATEGYHRYFEERWKQDLESMILRDRNHPSIVLWSIGNQIMDAAQASGVRTAQQITEVIRTLDPTRPTTSNVFKRRNDWHDLDPFFATLDVAGYSYAREQYDADHQRLPDRIIYSSEIDPGRAFDNWMAVLDRDFLFGNFSWTAIDYMGESGLGWWSYGHSDEELFPWTVNYSGDIDICGFKRPRSYYRDVLWKQGPRLSTFVHCPEPSFAGGGKSSLGWDWGWDDVKASWTWPGQEGKPLKVDVYSSCDRVQLLLNGKNLGSRETSRATEFKASWQVPYEPGRLTAIGYTNDIETVRYELGTVGAPAALRLFADRIELNADGQDLCYVTVEVVDENGLRNPNAEVLVHFAVEGEGELAAVGSSNPISLESFQQPERTTYDGRCLVILKAGSTPGTIRLTAQSDGLAESTLEIEAQPWK